MRVLISGRSTPEREPDLLSAGPEGDSSSRISQNNLTQGWEVCAFFEPCLVAHGLYVLSRGLLGQLQSLL